MSSTFFSIGDLLSMTVLKLEIVRKKASLSDMYIHIFSFEFSRVTGRLCKVTVLNVFIQHQNQDSRLFFGFTSFVPQLPLPCHRIFLPRHDPRSATIHNSC